MISSPTLSPLDQQLQLPNRWKIFAIDALTSIMYSVGSGKMSMVGQSESNDIFVSELKAKDQELIITGSSVLLSLFKWENKNVDLITMSSLIFGTQKIFEWPALHHHTHFASPHPRPS